jgi:hypothetical protein
MLVSSRKDTSSSRVLGYDSPIGSANMLFGQGKEIPVELSNQIYVSKIEQLAFKALGRGIIILMHFSFHI